MNFCFFWFKPKEEEEEEQYILNKSLPSKPNLTLFPSCGGVGLFVRKGSGWFTSLQRPLPFQLTPVIARRRQPTKQPPERQRSLEETTLPPALRGAPARRSNPLSGNAPFKLQSPPFPSSGGVGLFIRKGSGWFTSLQRPLPFQLTPVIARSTLVRRSNLLQRHRSFEKSRPPPNKKDPFKGALPAINITSVSGSSTPKT